jgi:hypothetical protein
VRNGRCSPGDPREGPSTSRCNDVEAILALEDVSRAQKNVSESCDAERRYAPEARSDFDNGLIFGSSRILKARRPSSLSLWFAEPRTPVNVELQHVSVSAKVEHTQAIKKASVADTNLQVQCNKD